MALRLRMDGRILCAAIHAEETGDIYLDDAIHYLLSVELGIIVSEYHVEHQHTGEWWRVDEVPEGLIIDRSMVPASLRL